MRLSIEQAAERLSSGEVVGVPTETVYGLAASIKHPQAIAKIFELKGRPSSNPLIVHVSDRDEVADFVLCLPKDYDQLAQAFWPGPMTLVLAAIIEKVPASVRAGLSTVAIRVPSHPITRELLKLTGPLVMPSANLSGSPSATEPEHIEADFGAAFPVLAGGGRYAGLESTILMNLQNQWLIIRQGALSQEAFQAVLGYLPSIQKATKSAAPLCPGQLFRHYAPKAKLHLSKNCHQLENALIVGFSDRHYPKSNRLIIWGNSSQPEELAENLYATLRNLDLSNFPEAYVDISLPTFGLYATLHERLARAALQ